MAGRRGGVGTGLVGGLALGRGQGWLRGGRPVGAGGAGYLGWGGRSGPRVEGAGKCLCCGRASLAGAGREDRRPAGGAGARMVRGGAAGFLAVVLGSRV